MLSAIAVGVHFHLVLRLELRDAVVVTGGSAQLVGVRICVGPKLAYVGGRVVAGLVFVVEDTWRCLGTLLEKD